MRSVIIDITEQADKTLTVDVSIARLRIEDSKPTAQEMQYADAIAKAVTKQIVHISATLGAKSIELKNPGRHN